MDRGETMGGSCLGPLKFQDVPGLGTRPLHPERKLEHVSTYSLTLAHTTWPGISRDRIRRMS